MISLVIIVVLFIIGLYVLKISHFRHRFFIIFLIFIAIFLYVSLTLVQSKHNLDFTTFEGVSNSVKVYFGWLANGFQNLKAITGNAIKMDWASTDKTFFNKTSVSPGKK